MSEELTSTNPPKAGKKLDPAKSFGEQENDQ
jgi:hypothetical protein